MADEKNPLLRPLAEAALLGASAYGLYRLYNQRYPAEVDLGLELVEAPSTNPLGDALSARADRTMTREANARVERRQANARALQAAASRLVQPLIRPVDVGPSRRLLIGPRGRLRLNPNFNPPRPPFGGIPGRTAGLGPVIPYVAPFELPFTPTFEFDIPSPSNPLLDIDTVPVTQLAPPGSILRQTNIAPTVLRRYALPHEHLDPIDPAQIATMNATQAAINEAADMDLIELHRELGNPIRQLTPERQAYLAEMLGRMEANSAERGILRARLAPQLFLTANRDLGFYGPPIPDDPRRTTLRVPRLTQIAPRGAAPDVPRIAGQYAPARLVDVLANPEAAWAQIENIGANEASRRAASGPPWGGFYSLDEFEAARRARGLSTQVPLTQLRTSRPTRLPVAQFIFDPASLEYLPGSGPPVARLVTPANRDQALARVLSSIQGGQQQAASVIRQLWPDATNIQVRVVADHARDFAVWRSGNTNYVAISGLQTPDEFLLAGILHPLTQGEYLNRTTVAVRRAVTALPVGELVLAGHSAGGYAAARIGVELAASNPTVVTFGSPLRTVAGIESINVTNYAIEGDVVAAFSGVRQIVLPSQGVGPTNHYVSSYVRALSGGGSIPPVPPAGSGANPLAPGPGTALVAENLASVRSVPSGSTFGRPVPGARLLTTPAGYQYWAPPGPGTFIAAGAVEGAQIAGRAALAAARVLGPTVALMGADYLARRYVPDLAPGIDAATALFAPGAYIVGTFPQVIESNVQGVLDATNAAAAAARGRASTSPEGNPNLIALYPAHVAALRQQVATGLNVPYDATAGATVNELLADLAHIQQRDAVREAQRQAVNSAEFMAPVNRLADQLFGLPLSIARALQSNPEREERRAINAWLQEQQEIIIGQNAPFWELTPPPEKELSPTVNPLDPTGPSTITNSRARVRRGRIVGLPGTGGEFMPRAQPRPGAGNPLARFVR